MPSATSVRRAVHEFWAILTDRMVLRFAGLSLVVVVGVGVLIGVSTADRLRASQLDAAHSRAAVTGHMLRHELMMAGPAALSGDDEATQNLLDRFEAHLAPAQIPEALVWSPTGVLLLSTADVEPRHRGHVESEEFHQAWASGEPVSTIADADDGAGAAGHHVVAGRAFTTFLASGADGAPADAVIELVQDYAPTAAAIGAELRSLVATLIGALMVLYLLLLPIVVSASRRLRQLVTTQEEHVEQLEQAESIKDTFLEAVSHEMRTPLTAIAGMLELLRSHDQQLSEEARTSLIDRAAANSERLRKLLENLLDVDRLTRKVIAPQREQVQLDDVVARAVDHVSTNGHLVELDLEACSVSVDITQVERIVENLVANAVKYTPPRTRLWVRVTRTHDGAMLVVEDDGPGVPADSHERIFEPFERAHDMSHTPGTGVGLVLVRDFARMHGGNAWVEDRPDGGARFTVHLPTAPSLT